jgi:ornithine cyclodeaminase/alanine dehydrogenase-like protein (mu-crystallin family)
VRILNRAAVGQALSHAQCVVALDPTMRAVSEDRAIMPLRQYMNIPGTDGKFTMMPGYVDTPRTFGFKVVAKFPREADSKYGSHVGAVMIFDADIGIPIALMDGAELTAIRTASASALATKTLARDHSSTLAILGTGTQAEHHVHAIRAVRPIRNIRIWGRNQGHAAKLLSRLQLPDSIQTSIAEDVTTAVESADIVCTTTAATTPILEAAQISPGCHVNLVGAAIIEAAESSADLVAASRFFVDYRASALAQAGELACAIREGLVDESHIAGEIGEVLLGQIEGRQDASQITVYKSLGVAAQDLAAAFAAYENAERLNLGTSVDWH